MNIRRICLAGVMAVVAMNAWSAGSAPSSAGKTRVDVNGTWNASVEGRGTPMNYVFVFKQDKKKLSGTMSVNGAPPVEIKDAKVYATKITFETETMRPAMQMPGAPPNPSAAQQKVVTKYEATVDGDSMVIETSGGGRGGMGGMGGGMGMGGGGMGGGGGGGMSMGGGGGMGMGGGMRMGGMNKITATRQK